MLLLIALTKHRSTKKNLSNPYQKVFSSFTNSELNKKAPEGAEAQSTRVTETIERFLLFIYNLVSTVSITNVYAFFLSYNGSRRLLKVCFSILAFLIRPIYFLLLSTLQAIFKSVCRAFNLSIQFCSKRYAII